MNAKQTWELSHQCKNFVFLSSKFTFVPGKQAKLCSAFYEKFPSLLTILYGFDWLNSLYGISDNNEEIIRGYLQMET